MISAELSHNYAKRCMNYFVQLIPIWAAALACASSSVLWGQNYEPASSALDDTIFVDPSSPVIDTKPQYDVRQSALTGNPAIRPFDAARPTILSENKCIGRNSDGTYANLRYLLIHYPWEKIQGGSIEIRILDDKVKEKPAWCVPLFFNEVYRKQNTINDTVIQYMEEDSETIANSIYFDKEFTKNELLPPSKLIILSYPVLTGRKGTAAYVHKDNPNTDLDETTLVFPKLSQFGVNPETLYLQLKGEEFDTDCDIRIWLIKNSTIIWEEDFVWPGNKSASENKKIIKKETKPENS